jgi:hypothetical protein
MFHLSLQVVPVDCHLYDGTVVQALTLQAAAASLHTGRRALPSQRYLSLLQEGKAATSSMQPLLL